jgi:hypothetical protein
MPTSKSVPVRARGRARRVAMLPTFSSPCRLFPVVQPVTSEYLHHLRYAYALALGLFVNRTVLGSPS